MNYRYPGPQSFREEDELLFHGRKREIKALHDLVMAQSLVVLFAKSGMGKTSLLQAGILPKLRFSSFDAVKIRLNKTTQPLEQQVLDALLPGLPPDTLLWEALLRYNRERLGTPILIFDQFEEVFTLYSEQERAEFVRQLADVANLYLPEKIRSEIRRRLAEGNLLSSENAALEQLPSVKIVFSIRSDLLHCLHDLSDEIPSILRNRFELRGLEREQAREAIVRPAEQPRELGDFDSPEFDWSPAAIEQILNYLSQRQQTESRLGGAARSNEIETFQLQLLCEHIEKKVAAVGQGRVVVQPDFYGGEAGIEQVLANFYENTLALVADADTRQRARRLLEDHLIKNQRRVSIDETTIGLPPHSVPPEVLQILVEARLLRCDPRETGNYYEISHDTLLQPMLRSKAAWDKIETERLAAINAAKLEKEARRRRRATMIAAAAIGLAVLASGASLLAFWQYRKAERAKIEIFKNALDAQRNLARMLKGDGKYPEAVEQLDKLLASKGDIEAAVRDSIRKTRDDWQRVGEHITAAENHKKTGDLRQALEQIEAARRISPDPRIEDNATRTAAELETRFKDLCHRADLLRGTQLGLAKDYYEAALRLKPDNKEVKEKLKKIAKQID